MLGLGQQEFAQHYPQPGWVEHDAEEIWATQRAAAAEALRQAGLGAGGIAAIGIANQRETVVLWERATGRPLAPAIVWQDRRTAALCEALRAHEDEIRARSGLTLDPYFSASKIAWWLRERPDWRARAERGELAVGTIDSWLLHRLSGAHATDVTNASRTQLMNLHSGQWDERLLALWSIPAALLPAIHPSRHGFGFSAEFGAPIAGMAGDQQAALLGQACTQAGEAKATYGTGLFLLLHTGGAPLVSRHGLLATRAAQLDARPQFALEGAAFAAGSIVQWLRDGLGLIRESGEIEALAGSVADSAGVVLVPAFNGLGAPHWRPEARAALSGLTRGSTAAHVARAALEAIAFQCADLVDAMRADGMALEALRVDGGACANNLLMQLQADALGVPVERPALLEATARGAALLAGLQAPLAAERRFQPAATLDREAWRQALGRV